mgnify:FL=1
MRPCAQVLCRKHRYFLKLDVHKFFDSIDHNILKQMLRRRIKDPDILWLADIFIDHPVPWTRPGKGIPIGNLTSQHFANFYLFGLDHFIKQVLRIKPCIRYMDDLVLFADEKKLLWDAAARIEEYLNDRLELKIKGGSVLLAPVLQGLPFLGVRIFPGVIRASRQGWRRFRRKALRNDRWLATGKMDEDAWGRSMASLVGHLKQADSRNLRASFFKARGGRGANRVMRGGSWNNDAQNCRSAIRNRIKPDNRNDNVGFRLSSSRQRPDAARPRVHRQRQGLDPIPGPVPA